MDYSSLNTYEYIAIIANYNQITQSDAEQKLIKRGYDSKTIKATLAKEKFNPVKSLNITFTEAQNFPLAEFGFYLSLHQAYKQGMPPFPGTIVEQPAKIIEVFNVLDSLQVEAEQRARKKASKENDRRVK